MNRTPPFTIPALLLMLLLPCAARSDAPHPAGAKSPARTLSPRTPKRMPVPTPSDTSRERASVGRTTIAPFPVPGDTSRASTERLKMMNVPRQGITTVAPLPPPAGEPHVIGQVQEGTVRLAPLAPSPAPYTFPQPRYAPAPVYPEAARKAGIQGTVLVQVHVLADGSVGEATIGRSIPALDSAALACARQMKFAPPMLDGRPTSTWYTVPVRFTLH